MNNMKNTILKVCIFIISFTLGLEITKTYNYYYCATDMSSNSKLIQSNPSNNIKINIEPNIKNSMSLYCIWHYGKVDLNSKQCIPIDVPLYDNMELNKEPIIKHPMRSEFKSIDSTKQIYNWYLDKIKQYGWEISLGSIDNDKSIMCTKDFNGNKRYVEININDKKYYRDLIINIYNLNPIFDRLAPLNERSAK